MHLFKDFIVWSSAYRFKMPTKYCAHGLCDSDSRKHPNIKFAKFIPPSVNRLRSERWVHLMGRKNFTVDNVKAWTYICEKHFPDNVNLKYYEVSFDLIIEKGKKVGVSMVEKIS